MLSVKLLPKFSDASYVILTFNPLLVNELYSELERASVVKISGMIDSSVLSMNPPASEPVIAPISSFSRLILHFCAKNSSVVKFDCSDEKLLLSV